MGDETKNSGKQVRVIGWAATGAVVTAVAVWFATIAVPQFISDAHADEHSVSVEQLDKVTSISTANATYINTQILTQLYLRADRLRKSKADGDSSAAEPLARAEVEIRRREAELAP